MLPLVDKRTGDGNQEEPNTVGLVISLSSTMRVCHWFLLQEFDHSEHLRIRRVRESAAPWLVG